MSIIGPEGDVIVEVAQRDLYAKYGWPGQLPPPVSAGVATLDVPMLSAGVVAAKDAIVEALNELELED